MPHGKQQGDNSALSSLATAALSDETRRALVAAGLSSFEGTEAQALAFLAVVGESTGSPAEWAPACFATEYGPERELCAGCVFAADCWTRDTAYLRRLKAGDNPAPPHVPDQIVVQVLASLKPARKGPPKPRRARK